MFDWILGAVGEYPYVGFAVLFLLCGIGLPLPEEIGLLAAGYVCATYPELATLPWMIVWCTGSILTGDLLPFVLGRVFGVRLLRLRWMRYLITKQRLAKFDRWFRRRGDAVIFIARFVAGLRVVAFFTAGTMKMPWPRFLFFDGLGIALLVPVVTWIGYHSAEFIQRAIHVVQTVERGLLWTTLGSALVLGLWVWLWRRRRQQRRMRRPGEAFVEPQRPVQQAATEQSAAEQGGTEQPATGQAATGQATERPADEPPAPPAASAGSTEPKQG